MPGEGDRLEPATGGPEPSLATGDGPGRAAEIERTAAYSLLRARRRRFTLVAGGLFFTVFGAFAGLAGWAHAWMSRRVSGGLTVGYLLALVVVASVWAVVGAYLRLSVRELDRLAERAQEERA